MKHWSLCCTVAFFLLTCLCGNSRAEIDFGGGMEYFTIKAQIDDGEEGFAHTMLQSTLVVAKVLWTQGPWAAEINGGISDWNVSGEWDGHGIEPYSLDVLGWAWQQKSEALLTYRVWQSLGAGVRFSDHALEHYDGLTHYRYTRYRQQGLAGVLFWQALRSKDVLIQMDLAYAPQDRLELSHVVPEGEYTYRYFYDTADVGKTWSGKVRLEYRDSAGWGLDLVYQFGWSEFDSPERVRHVTVKTGSLTGYFILRF